MKIKNTSNKNGEFKYFKHKKALKFTCERCNSSKTSKTQIEWNTNNDEIKIICNGCYGKLLSE